MKRIKLIFTLLLLIAVRGHSQQQMTYLKNGTVLLDNKSVKKTKQLKKLLQQQNSLTLQRLYKKYVRRKRTSQFFSSIAGIGFIMTVEDEFSPRPQINWSFLGIGIASSITAELFHRPAKKVLREIVDVYNEEIYIQSVKDK